MTTAAQSAGEAQWIVPARLARAEAHWLAGERDAAIHEIELGCASWADADAWQRGEVAAWRRRLALPEPAAATSDEDSAAPSYDLQLRGAGEQAARSFLDLGSPYEAALALLDTDEEESLRRALEILTELGAPATARQVRQRLRRQGVRSVPRGAQAATRAHPLGLTGREREVLDLVCEGCSNAEIATRLVLSVKTVDHHVSAVLAKLGAPTRQAAARTAARLGVAGRAQLGSHPAKMGSPGYLRRVVPPYGWRQHRSGPAVGRRPRTGGAMPLFMDVRTIAGGVAIDDVAKAHRAGLQTQGQRDVSYLRCWVDEAHGKVFCLVEAQSAGAASEVHRQAHGLVADDIFQVREKS